MVRRSASLRVSHRLCGSKDSAGTGARPMNTASRAAASPGVPRACDHPPHVTRSCRVRHTHRIGPRRRREDGHAPRGPDFTPDSRKSLLSASRAVPRARALQRATRMMTDGTYRARPARGRGRSVTGRQRRCVASASHLRIDGRAGARGQVLAMSALSLIGLCALSQTGTGLATNGSGSSLSAACGIVVNSSAASALNAGSGAVFGTSVAVTGTYSGSCSSSDPSGCRNGVPPQPDPLAQLADPQFSGCDFGAPNPVNVSGGVVTLNPGVYCNGISIGSGASVTFQPGVYILNGGGLSVSGNSTIQGTGVTFYNTAQGKYSYAAVSITGGTLGFLYAPTSGPTEGILFFQDRTITPKSSQSTNVIAGSSNLNFNGTFYFPTTNLTFSGGGQVATNYTIIVAKTVVVGGNTTLSANFSSLQDGNPIKKITLAE